MMRFITFEGIDGSGKSTQLERLAEALRRQGQPVLVTRDPGGTDLGREIRQILLHHPGFVADRCELFLYLADRAQHVAEKIKPALDSGQIVLCDRYVDSTLAYQGGGRGLPIDEIKRLNDFVSGGLTPDKTFLLDAPVPELLARAKNRGSADRLERESVAFYERIRAGFLAQAQAEPNRIQVIDALQPADIIHQHILASLPY